MGVSKHRGANRPRLSLCMIALDEEELIRGCLESVRGVVDEIILGLDTRTIDRTAKIARGHGARVIPIDWRDDFSYARNLTLEAARGDWQLVLDADDRLSPDGARAVRWALDKADSRAHAEQLAQLAAAQGISGVVDRIGVFMFELAEHDLDGTCRGTWLGSCRLFRREAGIRYSGRIHEQPDGPSTSAFAVLPGGPHIRHLGFDEAHFDRRGKADRNLRLAQLRVADEPDSAMAHYQVVRAADRMHDIELAHLHARRALELGGLGDVEKDALRSFLACGSANWMAGLAGGGGVDRDSQIRALMNTRSGPVPTLRL